MGLFDGIFSSSDGKKAATQANNARISGLRTGEDRAFGYMDQGIAAAKPQYEKALNAFDQWYDAGSSANQMYANALGLNGAVGNAAATSAFQTSPGYQFQVDQATEAAKRNAASMGMLGSGNTMIGIADRTQNIANQEYNNWLGNLNTASQSGQNAAGSQAGYVSALGDFEYGDAAARAALAHGTETSVGQSNAQKATDIAAAKQAASSNIWNSILGLANLGGSYYGSLAPTKTTGDVGLGTWDPTVFRS